MVKIDNSCLGSVSAALTIFVKISGVSSFKNSLKATAFLQMQNVLYREDLEKQEGCGMVAHERRTKPRFTMI